MVFKLFLKNSLSKGFFAALYRCHGNRWDIANTLKNLWDNSFIQMTKHCSSDWDNSVVIFLHWTSTSNGGKPFRASLINDDMTVLSTQMKYLLVGICVMRTTSSVQKKAFMPCISNFSDQILEEPPLRHALQP